MNTHVFNLSVPMYYEPFRQLERQDLHSSALGAVGNLRFSVKEGGTGRTNRVAEMLSRLCRSLANKWTNLKFALIRAPRQARAQHEVLVKARENSRYIGNLLGSLTGCANDAGARARIARALAPLAEQSRGDVNALRGGRYCLGTYVDELTTSDVQALREGVLSRQDAWWDVLAQLPSDGLSKHASHLLSQVKNALDQRLVKDSASNSFAMLIGLPSAASMGAEKLKIVLLKLTSEIEAMKMIKPGFDDEHYLDVFIQHLPKSQLQQLRALVNGPTLDECREALLGRAANGLEYVGGVLNLIQDSPVIRQTA